MSMGLLVGVFSHSVKKGKEVCSLARCKCFHKIKVFHSKGEAGKDRTHILLHLY